MSKGRLLEPRWWMEEQDSDDWHPGSLMPGSTPSPLPSASAKGRDHMCAGVGGAVLTVGVPRLCLHLPIFGVLPAGKAQAAPELASRSRAIPIPKHLQLEATRGDQVKIPKWEPALSGAAQRWSADPPPYIQAPAPSLEGPRWRKELPHSEVKCASTWPTPRAAALPSGLRDRTTPSTPGQPLDRGPLWPPWLP